MPTAPTAWWQGNSRGPADPQPNPPRNRPQTADNYVKRHSVASLAMLGLLITGRGIAYRRRWLRDVSAPACLRREHPVAIYRIFKTIAFEPEAIAIMSAAYEDALRILQLADREDPITELVAKKIIEVAQSGVTSSVLIREMALKELGITPPAPPGQ